LNLTLEIIGFNIESCITAQNNGAGRIELCASPGEGGTTPPLSLIKAARKILQIPLYIMVRPRGGDFLYTDNEFEMMIDDVKACRQSGADGVVIGILNPEGDVDTIRCSKLVETAYPMGVTFHRAFDRVRDYKKSLKDVISTGCERILTSGLSPNCIDGIHIIKELVDLANDDIIIMPGSGVRSSNIKEIIQKSGAVEIHSSASRNVASLMKYQNSTMNESLDHVSVNGDEVLAMSAILQTITTS